MNDPGYTLLDHMLLRYVINPENKTNAFMLLTPHGEIIYGASSVKNEPVLAMCYSGVPLTVNYSYNDENVRVLSIVNDNLRSTLRKESFDKHTKTSEQLAADARRENPHHFQKILALTPDNPAAIYEELQLLASAVKKGDTQHHDSRTMAAKQGTQINDSHKSFLFSQSYPITKMVADDGTLIHLEQVVHPNKRYTLRVDDEVASGTDFEYKMNLFLPTSSSTEFEKYLEGLEKTAGIIIVTKKNYLKYQSIVRNVNGSLPEIILGQNSVILASWNIILLPVLRRSGTLGHDITTYYMLPYRFHTLSGVSCVVFDLWHILCYVDPHSEYSTRGLSMTQTDIYMQLLTILGIQLVVGVDLTCNVVGVESGAWPLLTYDQIIRNLTFQETMLQSIGGKPLSSRINVVLDLLPHFKHVVNELNEFLKSVTESKTLTEVLESIHGRGRIGNRGFYSNDTETYLALHEYMKRLCGHEVISPGETFYYEQDSIMVVRSKKRNFEEALTKREVCNLYKLITYETIDNLRKYVTENSIQFRLTDKADTIFKRYFPNSEKLDDDESEGGGNTTKMSNTRKRKPHKRGRTKRYRRYKNKSLKNKSLKNKVLKIKKNKV